MENKRVAISKKIRFEIFKRDNFKCQYCGGSPPKVILEVDHIIPVVKGGKNVKHNLLTACFDCNRGKGKHELHSVPESPNFDHALIKEKIDQYKMFTKMQTQLETLFEKEIDSVSDVYSQYFPDWILNTKFRNGTVKKFIELLNPAEVRNAMHIACSKISWNEDKALKYFCGVCWGKIRDRI